MSETPADLDALLAEAPSEPEPAAAPEPEAEPDPEAEAEAATEAPGPSAPEPPADESSPDEPSDDDEGIEVAELPGLDDDTLIPALEALLLVVDAPASEDTLATALDVSVSRVSAALTRMAADYTDSGRGIDLRKMGEGWRFFTRDRYAPYVEKLLLDGQRARLTRAALETLAVIAYRQPVTRARIAAVRGVNVDGVIRTLVLRGLIEETGTDAETGGLLYRTTELFLERLGLSSLEDLPPIAPLLPEVDAIEDV